MSYYKIVRHYYKSGARKTIKRVSSLAIAQLHCRDPKTRKEGVWFDGYSGPHGLTEAEQVKTQGRY